MIWKLPIHWDIFHHDFRMARCKYVEQISTESIISKTWNMKVIENFIKHTESVIHFYWFYILRTSKIFSLNLYSYQCLGSALFFTDWHKQIVLKLSMLASYSGNRGNRWTNISLDIDIRIISLHIHICTYSHRHVCVYTKIQIYVCAFTK